MPGGSCSVFKTLARGANISCFSVPDACDSWGSFPCRVRWNVRCATRRRRGVHARRLVRMNAANVLFLDVATLALFPFTRDCGAFPREHRRGEGSWRKYYSGSPLIRACRGEQHARVSPGRWRSTPTPRACHSQCRWCFVVWRRWTRTPRRTQVPSATCAPSPQPPTTTLIFSVRY